MKRFQDSNFLIKLLRYRWYLLIPFEFIYLQFKGLKIYKDKELDGRIYHTDEYFFANKEICWSLCVGNAQRRMKWYYEMDEVFDRIRERKNKTKKWKK